MFVDRLKRDIDRVLWYDEAIFKLNSFANCRVYWASENPKAKIHAYINLPGVYV